MLYHEGRGVPKDARLAYYWVRVAALQGDTVAADALPPLRAQMTEAQVAEAEAQAQDWMQRARKAAQ
jgi:TPR repeat protein